MCVWGGEHTKCRLKLEALSNTTDEIDRIKQIAELSFLRDIRFLDAIPYDERDIKRNIDAYVDDCNGKMYGNYFKGILVGFIEVVENLETKHGVIRLAAVDEKYRMTGSAMSLYTGVVMRYRAEGFHSLTGRISSRNMPVMNLYAALGAKFSEPLDIYGKA